jgi:hypothetical protein
MHNNNDHVCHMLWSGWILLWFVGLWACRLHCRPKNTQSRNKELRSFHWISQIICGRLSDNHPVLSYFNRANSATGVLFRVSGVHLRDYNYTQQSTIPFNISLFIYFFTIHTTALAWDIAGFLFSTHCRLLTLATGVFTPFLAETKRRREMDFVQLQYID